MEVEPISITTDDGETVTDSTSIIGSAFSFVQELEADAARNTQSAKKRESNLFIMESLKKKPVHEEPASDLVQMLSMIRNSP